MMNLFQSKELSAIVGVDSGKKVLLDARISEDHSMKNSLTEYPIEEGYNILDHVRNEPIQLSMEGYVSDSPVQYLGGALSQFGDKPSKSAYDTFIALFESGELVSVQTTLKLYENMAIVDLKFPRNTNTFGALWFNATFQEVKVVGEKELTEKKLGNGANGLKDRAMTKQILGSQPTRIVTLAALAGVISNAILKGAKS